MLADNCMNRIQLSTDDDGFSAVSNDSADELDDWVFKIVFFAYILTNTICTLI